MNTTWFVSIPAIMLPSEEVLVFKDTRLTYAQVQERINRLSNALRSLGLGRGSRVGIIQNNCNQCVETYYATSKLGGTFVPLNYRAKVEELTYMINTAQVDALLVGDEYVDRVCSIRAEIPSVKHWIDLDSKRRAMTSFERILSNASNDDLEEDMEGDETNILMYTSGTTALPKAVMLSYRNFFEYVIETVQPPDRTRSGATLLCVPLFHISGITAMMSSIYGGRRLVLMSQFDAKEWLRLVRLEKITNAFLVPAMIKKLLEEPELLKADLSSLETLSYGAAPMPLPVIRRAMEALPRNVGFINAFGQTETTATVTMLLPEDHRLEGPQEEIEKKLRRLSSIGRPLPDVEVKIVDEDGRQVPKEEIGEIMVRTSRLMKGYIGQERLSEENLVGGWMRTRDLGWVDEDGYVFLAGRKDDQIIRGDGKVGASSVETVLLYPGVSLEEDRHLWKRGGNARVSFPEAYLGSSRLRDILGFLGTVYESLELDVLRSNYLSAIRDLVPASAYGFHLLDQQTACRVSSSRGDVTDYFRDFDIQLPSAFDSLPMHMVWTPGKSGGSSSATAGDWLCLPFQEVACSGSLAHSVRTPILSADGRLLGALSFVRSGERPTFEWVDLGIIRLVAHHMRVVLANALKYAEIRERCSVAEGALQVIGVAVVVSDAAGNIKFANLRARKLMELDNHDTLPARRTSEGLRSNLLEMEKSGKRIVTSTIRLERYSPFNDDCLTLRSVRIPSGEQAIATFIYSVEQAPNFQHLSSLLSKREIEVLELVAQGLHNREIAQSLVVTSNTVKHHLKQIFLKMQVTSRSELLAKAFSLSSED